MTDDTAALSPAEWVAHQKRTILESGTTESVDMFGFPVVLLTVRGAKSGKQRHTLVMRVEHGGSYALIASKGGADDHPDWYFNVKADPEIRLQDGTTTRTYVVRELDEGAEREEWWERATAAFPQYAEYKRNTSRRIPVLVAETRD